MKQIWPLYRQISVVFFKFVKLNILEKDLDEISTNPCSHGNLWMGFAERKMEGKKEGMCGFSAV